KASSFNVCKNKRHLLSFLALQRCEDLIELRFTNHLSLSFLELTNGLLSVIKLGNSCCKLCLNRIFVDIRTVELSSEGFEDATAEFILLNNFEIFTELFELFIKTKLKESVNLIDKFIKFLAELLGHCVLLFDELLGILCLDVAEAINVTLELCYF